MGILKRLAPLDATSRLAIAAAPRRNRPADDNLKTTHLLVLHFIKDCLGSSAGVTEGHRNRLSMKRHTLNASARCGGSLSHSLWRNSRAAVILKKNVINIPTVDGARRWGQQKGLIFAAIETLGDYLAARVYSASTIQGPAVHWGKSVQIDHSARVRIEKRNPCAIS